MKHKILKIIIEKKRKQLNNVPNNEKKDDIQNHMLQKPIQTGYSINTP